MLQQHPALWPYPTRQAALKDFQDCAGMVQTRSFHLAKIDHAKGTSEEGAECAFLMTRHDLEACWACT